MFQWNIFNLEIFQFLDDHLEIEHFIFSKTQRFYYFIIFSWYKKIYYLLL